MGAPPPIGPPPLEHPPLGPPPIGPPPIGPPPTGDPVPYPAFRFILQGALRCIRFFALALTATVRSRDRDIAAILCLYGLAPPDAPPPPTAPNDPTPAPPLPAEQVPGGPG